jgi:beta-phosphoglucomutase-like phosphatase (HAD superfamily)
MKMFIFDFDGVLLDSMSISYRCVCEIFRGEGLTEPSYLHFARTFKHPYADFYARLGVRMPYHEIKAHYDSCRPHEISEFFGDVIGELECLP